MSWSSASAVLRAAEICAASDRLTVVVVGTNDLTKELAAEHVPGRQPLLTSLQLCLLAAWADRPGAGAARGRSQGSAH